jgi:ankyrin repeat protein
VEQVEFLKKFWLKNLNIGVTNRDQLQIYATALIRKLAQSISDKDKEFTGIPLQTLMLAEAFEEGFRSFILTDSPQPELPHKLDLLLLYGQFIERKYDIFYTKKAKLQKGNQAADGIRESYSKILKLVHQRLALQALFTETELTFLQIDDDCSTISDEQLARIGIAQRSNEGKPHFIHRTFAEYFVAEFLIKQLTKKTKLHTQVQEVILDRVLSRADFQGARFFLNGLLEKGQPSVEVLQGYGKKLDEQWNGIEVNRSSSALHAAAVEDNARVIRFLLDSLKSGEHSNATRKMLLATDDKGQTALHMAADTNRVQPLKEIWEWVEILNLNTKELKNTFLLTQDKNESMAWHRAAVTGNPEAIETLWSSVTEVDANELKKNFLLAKDQYGLTAWHLAAIHGSLEALETLWSLVKKAELNRNELLVAQCGEGSTALHRAAYGNHIGILEKLWVWAEEAEVNSNELKKKLLLAKDDKGLTAWHRAAIEGTLEALEVLWSWAKKMELKPNEFFLAHTEPGMTALHIAAIKNHVGILEKLLFWAEEAEVNAKELKKKLLLAEDDKRLMAWHGAAIFGSLEALETLWSWAKEVEIKRDELLLAQVKEGSTALHIAARGNHVGILQKLWFWAEEAEVKANELKKKLLLAKDHQGYTAWQIAEKFGSLEALGTLNSWYKEVVRNRDEL